MQPLISKKSSTVIVHVGTIDAGIKGATADKIIDNLFDLKKEIENKLPEAIKNDIHTSMTFLCFDIIEFYPSISEELLNEALCFAKLHACISQEDMDIIFHSRKSLLFNNGNSWVKKESSNLFDVTMGSYDGAEVCELVGAFILNELASKYDAASIGLYRDDGLAVFKNVTGRDADKTRKDFIKVFNSFGLRITIRTNLKTVNFLDITLNLTNGVYSPYRKPNDKPMYINKLSNHPPNIIKNLRAGISRRLSDISHNREIFNQVTPIYNEALQSSGYTEKVSYTEYQPKKHSQNRQRNIIWFNPPFSKHVATNIGQKFLRLVAKHFPTKCRSPYRLQ